MSEKVSRREFARRMHLTIYAVQKAIEKGRIKVGKDNKLDWETQSREFKINRDTSMMRDNAIKDNEDQDLMTASKRKTHYEALKKEAEYKQMIGELIEIRHVKEIITPLCLALRDAWRNIPDRITANLAASLQGLTQEQLDDFSVLEPIVHDVLKTEIDNALMEVTQIEQKSDALKETAKN